MNDHIDWWPLLAGLFGGLGLFLLGLQLLTESLKALAGERLRHVLRRLTGNRFTALLTGAGVTAMVQSSSITTVLTIGFVSAGMLTFHHSLGVVIGANVGTTFTAQIIAFDIRTWALALVAVGSIGLVTASTKRLTIRANAILGIGLVFFAMQLMSEAMAPLRTSETFVDLMSELNQPLLGVLVGGVFTALVQSSSATTALVIVLASQGLVDINAGIALVLGANIGTCVTAVIAAIGKPPAAKRVAVAHVGFNLIGALAWIGLIDQLAWLALAMPGSADPARELANAHTVFNVVNALVLLPLLSPIARLIEKMVPDRIPENHLDPSLAITPALGLQAARGELARLAGAVVAMSEAIPHAVLDGNGARLDRLAADDDEVDARHHELVDFLARLSREPLLEHQTEELVSLLTAANDLESIGDVIETNLVRLGRHRLAGRIVIDPATRQELLRLHREVHRALELATTSLLDGDEEAAALSVGMKKAISKLASSATGPELLDVTYHRLGGRAVEVYALEQDIAENLKRIYYFAKRIARVRLSVVDNGDVDSVADPVEPVADG